MQVAHPDGLISRMIPTPPRMGNIVIIAAAGLVSDGEVLFDTGSYGVGNEARRSHVLKHTVVVSH